MEGPPVAIYDANILYPAPIRDLFIRLAQSGLVQARWTDKIHEEWLRNVLQKNPHLSAERLARTRELMNSALRDSLVSGYESLIDSLVLPDPDDRHVLAAAIQSKADLIVTYNLKDFPAEILDSFGIEALHPDDFLASLIEITAQNVCATVKRQREALKNPPFSVEEFLTILENQGLIQSVASLRQFSELL